MPDAIAVGFAAVLLVFVTRYAWLRRASLNLADVFLVSIALFFGAYTLVDVTVNRVRWLDSMVVLATFTQIGIGAAALRVYSRIAPRWVRTRTSLRALYRDLLASNWLLVAGILLAGLVFRVISADLAGGLEVQNQELVAQREATLPYWFTSISQFLPMMVFTAGLAAAAKAFGSDGRRRIWWAAWTCASVVFFFGAGRRALLALLLVVFWMYVRTRRRAFTLLLASVVGIPILIGTSNLFQAYREVAYRGAVVAKADVGGLLEQATNLELTATNLENREAIWRFNASVMQAGRTAPRPPGALFAGAAANYVPAVLVPSKTLFDPELELLRDRHMREYDGASNVFVLTFADFGMLSFLIAPAALVLFVRLVAAALRLLRSPHLRALLLSSAVYYALNMEAGYAQPLQLARDFTIIALLHWGVVRAARVFRIRRRWRRTAATWPPSWR